MDDEYIIIRSCRKRKYNDWADRFVLVYSCFDGKHFSYPLEEKLQAIEVDGDSALKIACSLEETHPHIFKHAMEMAQAMSCNIERNRLED